MMTLMIAAAAAAAQPAPVQPDVHAQHQQTAPAQGHEQHQAMMDCCKECCKDMMSKMHEGHGKDAGQQHQGHSN